MLKNEQDKLSFTDYQLIGSKIETLKETIAIALQRWSELAERDY